MWGGRRKELKERKRKKREEGERGVEKTRRDKGKGNREREGR